MTKLNFKDLVDIESKETSTPQELGLHIEKYVVPFCLHKSGYKNIFKPKNDLGVDLIATDKDGNNVAFQVKHQSSKKIELNSMTNFLTDFDQKRKDHNLKQAILLDTNNKGITANCKNLFANNNILHWDGRNQIFNFQTDDKEYNAWKNSNSLPQPSKGIILRCRNNLQKKGYNDISKTLKEKDIISYIAECGTGKMHIAQMIMFYKKYENILVVVPKIALANEWTGRLYNLKTKNIEYQIQLVNSDDSKNFSNYNNIKIPTTDSNEIKNFITNKKFQGKKIIIVVDKSLDKIASAIKTINKEPKENFQFDLVIGDEAHNYTGVYQHIDVETRYNNLLIHDREEIPRKKTLFTTATRRMFSAKDDNTFEIFDFNNNEIFGKIINGPTYIDAFKAELLCDYIINFPILKKTLEQEFDLNLKKYLESSELDLKCIDAHNLAIAISIFKTSINEYKETKRIQKGFAFFNRTENANEYKKILEKIFEYWNKINPNEQYTFNIATHHSKMNDVDREKVLHDLKESKKDINIVLTVNTLSEGVDVPDANLGFIIDPIRSRGRIQQKSGRLFRINENKKKIAKIFVPVFMQEEKISEGKSLEHFFEDSSYKIIVYTLIHMKQDNTLLQDEITNWRRGKIENNKIRFANDSGIALKNIKNLDESSLKAVLSDIELISLDVIFENANRVRSEKCKLIKDFIVRKGRLPKHNSSYKEEQQLARYIHTMRSSIKAGTPISIYEMFFEIEIFGHKGVIFNNSLAVAAANVLRYNKFYEKNGRKAQVRAENKEEKNIALIVQKILHTLKKPGNQIPDENKKLLLTQIKKIGYNISLQSLEGKTKQAIDKIHKIFSTKGLFGLGKTLVRSLCHLTNKNYNMPEYTKKYLKEKDLDIIIEMRENKSTKELYSKLARSFSQGGRCLLAKKDGITKFYVSTSELADELKVSSRTMRHVFKKSNSSYKGYNLTILQTAEDVENNKEHIPDDIWNLIEKTNYLKAL